MKLNQVVYVDYENIDFDETSGILFYEVKKVKDFETIKKFKLYDTTFDKFCEDMNVNLEQDITSKKIIYAAIQMAYLFQYQAYKLHGNDYQITNKNEIYISYLDVINHFFIIIKKLTQEQQRELMNTGSSVNIKFFHDHLQSVNKNAA